MFIIKKGYVEINLYFKIILKIENKNYLCVQLDNNELQIDFYSLYQLKKAVEVTSSSFFRVTRFFALGLLMEIVFSVN